MAGEQTRQRGVGIAWPLVSRGLVLLGLAGGVLEVGCAWIWVMSPQLTAIYNAEFTARFFERLPALSLVQDGVLRGLGPIGEATLNEQIYRPIIAAMAENNYSPKSIEQLTAHPDGRHSGLRLEANLADCALQQPCRRGPRQRAEKPVGACECRHKIAKSLRGLKLDARPTVPLRPGSDLQSRDPCGDTTADGPSI